MNQALKSSKTKGPEEVSRSASHRRKRHPFFAIVPISIGNALEWFDIVIYGYLAVTISKVFFPSQYELTGLLIVLATFGASYAMRPIGSIVLGAYTDSAGRKKALNLSMSLMLLGTFGIAVAPTYKQGGMAGAVIIVIAKLIQGFSAGGEFGGATALLAEQDESRRGFFASWQVASQGLTTLLAALFGYFLNSSFTADQLDSWAWRIPFIFGLSIGPIAIYMRRNIEESEEFVESKDPALPIRVALVHIKFRILATIGLMIVSTANSYMMLYMPTYAIKQLGLPASAGFLPTIVVAPLAMVMAPIFGGLSDKFGRARVMLPGAIFMLIGVIPAFVALKTWPSLKTLILVELFIACVSSAYDGPLPAAMADLFPVRMRGLGLSVSYSLGVAIFGGFVPLIAQVLIERTGLVIAPAFMLSGATLISILCVLAARPLGLFRGSGRVIGSCLIDLP